VRFPVRCTRLSGARAPWHDQAQAHQIASGETWASRLAMQHGSIQAEGGRGDTGERKRQERRSGCGEAMPRRSPHGFVIRRSSTHNLRAIDNPQHA